MDGMFPMVSKAAREDSVDHAGLDSNHVSRSMGVLRPRIRIFGVDGDGVEAGAPPRPRMLWLYMAGTAGQGDRQPLHGGRCEMNVGGRLRGRGRGGTLRQNGGGTSLSICL